MGTKKTSLKMAQTLFFGSLLSTLPHLAHAQYMSAPMTGISAAPSFSTGVMAAPINISTPGNYAASASASAAINLYQSNANNASYATMANMNATTAFNNSVQSIQQQMAAAPMAPKLGGSAYGAAAFAPTLQGYTNASALNLGSQFASINTNYSNSFGAISNSFWNQYNSIMPNYTSMMTAQNNAWNTYAQNTRNAVLYGADRLPAGGAAFGAASNAIGGYGFSGMSAGLMGANGAINGGARAAVSGANPWAPASTSAFGATNVSALNNLGASRGVGSIGGAPASTFTGYAPTTPFATSSWNGFASSPTISGFVKGGVGFTGMAAPASPSFGGFAYSNPGYMTSGAGGFGAKQIDLISVPHETAPMEVWTSAGKWNEAPIGKEVSPTLTRATGL
jgi:hypothetical protein